MIINMILACSKTILSYSMRNSVYITLRLIPMIRPEMSNHMEIIVLTGAQDLFNSLMLEFFFFIFRVYNNVLIE